VNNIKNQKIKTLRVNHVRIEDLIIRHVEPNDISGMWPIIEHNSDKNRDLFINRVMQKRLLEEHYIPVALVHNKVCGYAWVHDYGPHIRVGFRTARLNDLFICEEYRRKGLGQQLFLAVRRWCETRNVKWLQWQSSEKAIPFYESLGLKGNPCPDPGHPFFEIEFSTNKE
jgi:GNAT superfamily N-acetyltransferase